LQKLECDALTGSHPLKLMAPAKVHPLAVTEKRHHQIQVRPGSSFNDSQFRVAAHVGHEHCSNARAGAVDTRKEDLRWQ